MPSIAADYLGWISGGEKAEGLVHRSLGQRPREKFANRFFWLKAILTLLSTDSTSEFGLRPNGYSRTSHLGLRPRLRSAWPIAKQDPNRAQGVAFPQKPSHTLSR